MESFEENSSRKNISEAPATTSEDRLNKICSRELILLVKEHPMIWDRHHTKYRDKVVKETAWGNIFHRLVPEFDNLTSSEQNAIGSHIVKKWNNIRDAYRKCNKKNSVNRRPYLYSDVLSFLTPIFDNQDQDTTEVSFEENEESTPFKCEENEIYLEDMVEEETPEVTPKRLKLRNTIDNLAEDDNDNIITLLTNIIKREEDEDRSFFKSITPTVKSLKESTKLEFRIKVLNILKDLKERDDKDRKRKVSPISKTDSECAIYQSGKLVALL